MVNWKGLLVDACGIKRRWRRRKTAISFEELSIKLWSEDFRMGQPALGKPEVSPSEYIRWWGELRELKHLSNARKRKRSDSLCSGERMGKSLNLYYVIACVRCCIGVVRLYCFWQYSALVEFIYFSWIALERATKEGDSPVDEKINKPINIVSSSMGHV